MRSPKSLSSPTRQNRAKKLLLKFVLAGFFVVFLFLGYNIFGVDYPSLFNDYFEDYNLGNLHQQGGWLSEKSPPAIWQVVNDRAYSGFNSAYSTFNENCIVRKSASSTTQGSQAVRFYLGNSTSTQGTIHWLADLHWQTYYKFENCATTTCSFYYIDGVVWQFFKDIEMGTWHTLKERWFKIDSAFKHQFKLDNENWSVATNTQRQDYQYVNQLRITGSNWWIDHITGEVELFTGVEPKLYPENPESCITNLVDFNNVLLNGRIEIPYGNPYTFNNLLVYLESAYTPATTTALTIQYYDIPLPDLKATDIYDYSATTSLSSDSPFWSIRYRFDGYDSIGKSIIYWVIFDKIPCNTILTEIEPLPQEIIEEIGFFEIPELENCDEISNFVERWLCKIDNTLKSIFIPSQEKVAELNQNIQLLKQKFPFNYLGSSFDFYSDIKDNVDSTSTIAFSVLGQNGDIDFAIWENTANLGGFSQKFSDIFRGFFTFIFLSGFIVYSINFGKRVFR